MGPCVRLIRALGAPSQAQPKSQPDRWVEFKETVKSKGFELREKNINEEWVRQSMDDNTGNLIIGRMEQPFIENDWVIAGMAQITTVNGRATEWAAVVHNKIAGSSDSDVSVDTTVVMDNRIFHLSSFDIYEPALVDDFSKKVFRIQGTSIKEDPDGTRKLTVLSGLPTVV